MRKATTVKPIMWRKPSFKKLSSNTKFVFLFLLTGPDTNLSGILSYSVDEICSFTKLDKRAVKASLLELVESRRILWDDEVDMILVVRWIYHNPVTNPKLLAGALAHIRPYEFHKFFEIANCLISGDDPDILLDSLSHTLSHRVYHTSQGQGQGDFSEKKEVGKKERSIRDAEEILAFLNETTGRTFTNTKEIIACLKREKCSIDDCKVVIKFKYDEWKGTTREKFVDPITPFRAKHFAGYLDAAGATAKPVHKPPERKDAQGRVMPQWEIDMMDGIEKERDGNG